MDTMHEDEAKPNVDSNPVAEGFKASVVLPGDDVTDLILASGVNDIKIGNGLQSKADGSSIVAIKAGVLSWKAPNRFFVLCNTTRYSPAVGDTVIGIIVRVSGDAYEVMLSSTSTAQLSNIAFEGASKRNRPKLRVGSVIFAHVISRDKHLAPELSCIAVSGPRKDWTTGESVFGELIGGTLVHVPTAVALRLVDPQAALLSALGEAFPFEIAVGLNGFIWINSTSSKQIIAVSNAIKQSKLLTDDQCRSLAMEISKAVA